MKERFPVQTAEYAVASETAHQPAFAYWVPFTLRKRDRIISATKARVARVTHKYGIEVHTSVKHEKEIDLKNGNTFWQDAIGLEMKNVSVAFKILENGDSVPIGWTQSSGHLVFDVKMDFTRKARWVKDGHLTKDPDPVSYTHLTLPTICSV